MQTLTEKIKAAIMAESYEDRAGRSVISVKSALDIVDRLAAEQPKGAQKLGDLISSSKAIEILKTEKECVLRNINNQCNRECKNCDLLREDAEILKAYDDAILALKISEVE